MQIVSITNLGEISLSFTNDIDENVDYNLFNRTTILGLKVFNGYLKEIEENAIEDWWV